MNIKKILIGYSLISTSIVVFLIALGYLDFMHYIAKTKSLCTIDLTRAKPLIQLN